MLFVTNPAFLWALTAAAVPLMLHLFQRRRTVVTPFPTLRFLKAAQKRSSSRVRFENFLLWLLRTLLILCIAFAFALPILRSAGSSSWLSRTSRDIAIVLDLSYSMNYELERGKVSQITRDAAVSIVEGLMPGDRVCLFGAADTPIPLIERPTSEHTTVIQAIRAAQPLPGSSQLDEAVAMALHTLEQEKRGRREQELYIMTDGQALAWHGFRDKSSDQDQTTSNQEFQITREQREKTALFTLLAGAEQPHNAAPSELKVSPLLLLAGQNARVATKILRSGPPQQITVGIEVNGEERARRAIDIDADTETSVEFVLTDLEPGTHIARITTPQDALPEDDSMLFLLRVRQQLPALIAGPRDSTRFLRAALAPGAADESIRQIESAELESTDLRDFQAVFLCDALPLSGQSTIRLEQYVKNGGVVVLFPGDNADVSEYAALPFLPAQPLATLEVPTDLAARQLKRIPPMMEQKVTFNLALPPGTVPTVALKRIHQIGDLADDAWPLITSGDDTPFMLGRAFGRGRVFQFTVAANREWSTFPLTALFLPSIHQLIRQGAGSAVQPPHLFMGSHIPANEAIPNFRESDTITTPSEGFLHIHDTGDHTYMIEELGEPGIYLRTSSSGGRPEPVMAVNSDRLESLLTPATPEEIQKWSGFKRMRWAREPEELLHLVDEFRNGRSLAEIFLWLGTLLALAEWWFANRIAQGKSRPTESIRVDLSGKVVT